MAPAQSITGKSPAFQFYPKDFTSDEEQAVMTLAECGAYMRLLCSCWTNGSIPDDIPKMAAIVKTTPSEMRKVWPAVSVKFIPHRAEKGRLVNLRLDAERKKQADFRKRQVDNGKRGGRPQKGLGFPGLTSEQDSGKPRKSSSSPISDLQSASSGSSQKSEVRPLPNGGDDKLIPISRGWGTGLSHRPSQHGDCLAHGPVCFRPRMADKYLPRFGNDRAAMVSWAEAVCSDWTDRTERGERVPEGDDFAFWAARYDEHHRHLAKPQESARTVALSKASEEFLRGVK